MVFSTLTRNRCAWMHRCRSSQIFGDAKDFCPNFPKLARKVRATFLRIFPPTKIMNTSFGITSKKCFHVMLHTLGAIHFYPYFQVVCPDCQVFCEHLHRFCQNFQEFCPDFREIKTFGGVLVPASYTTACECLFCIWHGWKQGIFFLVLHIND